MKPIEEGCIAVVHGAGAVNNGEVEVGKFIGCCDAFDPRYNDLWEVDREMVMFKYENGSREKVYVKIMAGRYMTRIDGGEFEEEETEELVTVDV